MKQKKPKPIPTIAALTEALRELDLKYLCDTSYDWVYDCDNYGCNDGSGYKICRCGKIRDFRINSVDTNGVLKLLLDNRKWVEKPSDEIKYCIGTILRRIRTDDLDADIRHSYYGEEVFGIKLNSVPKLPTDTNDAIRELLKLEYGWLMPEMEKAKFVCKAIDATEIVVGNTDHYRKLDRKAVEKYKEEIDKDLPLCLCLPDGKYFRLIDGYHRFMAANELGWKKLKIIVAESK